MELLAVSSGTCQVPEFRRSLAPLPARGMLIHGHEGAVGRNSTGPLHLGQGVLRRLHARACGSSRRVGLRPPVTLSYIPGAGPADTQQRPRQSRAVGYRPSGLNPSAAPHAGARFPHLSTAHHPATPPTVTIPPAAPPAPPAAVRGRRGLRGCRAGRPCGRRRGA